MRIYRACMSANGRLVGGASGTVASCTGSSLLEPRDIERMASTTTCNKERKRHFCEHCNEYVSKTLYHKHKQIYYDQKEKRWCHKPVSVDLDSDEIFVFSDQGEI